MPETESAILTSTVNASPGNIHHRIVKLMGNRFDISVISEDKQWASERIDDAIAEINRIEKLLSTFIDDSQTNQINQQAGIKPVKVDVEVYNLIHRSLKISELTQSAFDITYGSIDKRFWNFDTSMTELPGKEAARQSIKLINYRNVELDKNNSTVFLREKGMRIGFGGIGKGYAADMAKKILIAKGVRSGIVNASGDLTAWGTQPNGKPWTIGIADPDTKVTAFSSIDISDMSVATSGNYEKYAVVGGKKYSHTIDPKTGFPVEGIKCVTIITSNAELADAMATPVMVMGIKSGLHLINQVKNMECIIVDDSGNLFTSSNIRIK
jgi:thiamine biosynthesis lipoprotein